MEFKNNKPIFLQISEHICDGILQGTYREGERLPSVREYAAGVEVNANTVVRSFDWLNQKGIIFNKRGMGYFVSEGAREAVLKLRRSEFFEEQLPEFFRTMKALGITMEEIISYNEVDDSSN